MEQITQEDGFSRGRKKYLLATHFGSLARKGTVKVNSAAFPDEEVNVIPAVKELGVGLFVPLTSRKPRRENLRFAFAEEKFR